MFAVKQKQTQKFRKNTAQSKKFRENRVPRRKSRRNLFVVNAVHLMKSLNVQLKVLYANTANSLIIG